MVSQIDRLAPEQRHLAQIAAIIGRRFPAPPRGPRSQGRPLGRNHPTAARRGDPRSGQVSRAGIRVSTRSVARGRPVHSSTAAPSRVYRAVAVAVEALYAASLDDQLEVLAHYFSRSDDLPKALQYMERAAERAIALDAPTDAIDLWRGALDVAQRLGGDPASEARMRQRIDDTQRAAQYQRGS